MGINLRDKSNRIETMMNVILISNAESMRVMGNYFIEELANSEYQGAVPYILNRTNKNFGQKNPLSTGTMDYEDVLAFNFTLEESQREKKASKIETEIDGIKANFKSAFEKLIQKKYLREEDIKYDGWFTDYAWTRLFDGKSYVSSDLIYRLMFAMKLTPEEAYELAAASRHPIRLVEKREIILYLCLVEEVYDFTDVNDVLKRLEQKELAGTRDEEI